jgi:hypothetical protein
MPAHSRPKDGVLLHAYVAGIHVLRTCKFKDVDGIETRACASFEYKPVASRVDPTCDDKPGHDNGECSTSTDSALNQPQALEACMTFLADDDVIVHGDPGGLAISLLTE